MTVFFTSDEHYDHFNIIRYSGRPFISVDDMREQMIAKHNAIVSNTDIVFHLGDFSLKEKTVPLILPRLNGIKHLVVGNHDQAHPRKRRAQNTCVRYIRYGFSSVELFSQFEEFDLAHIPHTNTDARYPEWRAVKRDNRVLLCGHVHNSWLYSDNQVNVGVDQWNFTPVSIEEIRKLLKRQ